MIIPKHGSGRRVAVALALASLVAAAAPSASAGVTDNKTFTMDIDGTTGGAAPEVFAGDADAAVVVVLTNTSSNQDLGSVNITVPAPFTLVSAPDDAVPGGPVVELRNLSLTPGASRSVTLTLGVGTCTAAGPTAFPATAKQANDYSGVGNDFTLQPSDPVVAVTGTCGLSFVSAPKDSERTARITGLAFNPAGTPVAVEVRDAGGTARATAATATVTLAAANPSVPSPVLGGTTSANAVAGLATFTPGPTLAVSAFGYTMSASSAGLVGSAPSAPFVIVDDQVNCPANQPCSQVASASTNGQSVVATFGSGASSVSLLVSLGAADAPSFSCAGYPRDPGVLVSQFLFTGSGDDRTGQMTTTIPSASRPLNSYQVCWAAPYPFTTTSGAQAGVQGTKPGTSAPLYVGLLPDCPKKGAAAPPCIASRSFSKTTSSVSITVTASGEDPWRY